MDTGMIERLKAAIEGECDGLGITDSHAQAILQYVFGESPLTPQDGRLTEALDHLEALLDMIDGTGFTSNPDFEDAQAFVERHVHENGY